MRILRPLLVLLAQITALLLMAEGPLPSKRGDSRLSILAGLTANGVLVWLSSELLGVFGQLTFTAPVVFWTLASLALLTVATRRRKLSVEDNGEASCDPATVHARPSYAFCLPVTNSILAVTVLLLIALVAAPNNWDSMTYYLSKVMHWQQDQSLRFFPTHILRQLHAGPFAEMAVLQLQILTGSDRLANLVQVFGMLGSLVGVSYIAKMLDASVEGQALDVLIAVATPKGTLQSTSTIVNPVKETVR